VVSIEASLLARGTSGSCEQGGVKVVSVLQRGDQKAPERQAYESGTFKNWLHGHRERHS
jgi:hypothetical protein